jgi:enoyl-[acyl-carrier protein] reductase II
MINRIQTRVTDLFQIKYPIIQAGMIWCSGWELASAVSNAGGLGLLGAGSMYPDELRSNIQSLKKATILPFGVNVPLLYPETEKLIRIIIEEKVPVVFTSAGNPNTYTSVLKHNGIKVCHVVSNVKFAIKAADAGVDAIVAEGFEAGGHNGREETTTLVLIPLIKKSVTVPVIAAGGIATGVAMLASFVLGAEGVQIGSRFVASHESSAHLLFKNAVIKANEGDTKLLLKRLTPVRLLNNPFSGKVDEAESRGADLLELKNLLGRGRAKMGMFLGDLIEGELEIGQVSAAISEILPAGKILEKIVEEYHIALSEIKGM